MNCKRSQDIKAPKREKLTNDHNIEVEALADTLAVPLVGQVRKANVARQLPPNNVLRLARNCWELVINKVRKLRVHERTEHQ
jgi:hypothetical protein